MPSFRTVGGLRRFRRWPGPAVAALVMVLAGFVAGAPAVFASTAGVLADATVSPGTVVGGTPAQGTVTLVSAVGTDTVVTLSSTDTTVLTVPPSVTVPAGATSAAFTVTTFVFSGPGEFACVNATAGGVTSTPCLDSNPSPTGPVATAVTFSPSSVGGGSPATGKVTLSAAADGNTSLVTLVSSDPAVLSVPGEVVATAGSTTTAFPVTTASVTTTRSVTVTPPWTGQRLRTLTITPPQLFRLDAARQCKRPLRPASKPGWSARRSDRTLGAGGAPEGVAAPVTASAYEIARPGGSALSEECARRGSARGATVYHLSAGIRQSTLLRSTTRVTVHQNDCF